MGKEIRCFCDICNKEMKEFEDCMLYYDSKKFSYKQMYICLECLNKVKEYLDKVKE